MEENLKETKLVKREKTRRRQLKNKREENTIFKKSNVKISVLCPGPTRTNFNDVANVKFSLKSMESNTVVKYALKKTFKNKLIIIDKNATTHVINIKLTLYLFVSKIIIE